MNIQHKWKCREKNEIGKENWEISLGGKLKNKNEFTN